MLQKYSQVCVPLNYVTKSLCLSSLCLSVYLSLSLSLSFLQVFAGLVTMRKLCNHPDLVTCDYSQVRMKERRKRGREEKGMGAERSDPEDEEEEEFTVLNVRQTKRESGILTCLLIVYLEM